jgi:hypothetical protein
LTTRSVPRPLDEDDPVVKVLSRPQKLPLTMCNPAVGHAEQPQLADERTAGERASAKPATVKVHIAIVKLAPLDHLTGHSVDLLHEAGHLWLLLPEWVWCGHAFLHGAAGGSESSPALLISQQRSPFKGSRLRPALPLLKYGIGEQIERLPLLVRQESPTVPDLTDRRVGIEEPPCHRGCIVVVEHQRSLPGTAVASPHYLKPMPMV